MSCTKMQRKSLGPLPYLQVSDGDIVFFCFVFFGGVLTVDL